MTAVASTLEAGRGVLVVSACGDRPPVPLPLGPPTGSGPVVGYRHASQQEEEEGRQASSSLESRRIAGTGGRGGTRCRGEAGSAASANGKAVEPVRGDAAGEAGIAARAVATGRRPGWCVYVLRCADGSLYTGATNDLQRRLASHAAGKGARYTRSRLPVALVFAIGCRDRSAALRREAAVKRLDRAGKVAVVSRVAPAPRDLKRARSRRRDRGGAEASLAATADRAGAAPRSGPRRRVRSSRTGSPAAHAGRPRRGS